MDPTTPPRCYRCCYCGWDMITNSNLQHHQRVCLLSDRRSQEICKICAKKFNTSEELRFLRKCGKYQCFNCDIPFLTTVALNSHIHLNHRNENLNNARTYACSLCKRICTSRRELYHHRMNQHGGNDDDDDTDNEDNPDYIQNEENENIQEVYVTNRNHIKDYHHEACI